MAVWLAGSAGCDGNVRFPSDRTPLTDPMAWTVADGASDPWRGEGDEESFCAPEAVFVGDFGGEDVLEVESDGCTRVTVVQSARVGVERGDVVAVRLWHQPLSASRGDSAVLAVALDGREVWRRVVPLPQEEGAAVAEAWRADRSVPAGSQVAFHVRNHGRNSYHLFEVARGDGP